MSSSSNPWKTVSFILIGIIIGLFVAVPLSQNGDIFAFLKPDPQKKLIKTYIKDREVDFQYYEKNSARTDEGFYALGNKNAPVAMTEFSDFQCPFCATFFQNTLSTLKNDYVKKGTVYFVYKDLPLSFHPNAFPAASAAQCAGEQGRFFQMHDLLFNFTDMWAQEKDVMPVFNKFVKLLDLDQGDFAKCTEEGRYDEIIQKGMMLAEQSKVSGTPGFVINGELVTGAQPIETFQQAISKALSKETTTQP